MRSAWTPRLVLLSTAHFTIDGYSSFLAPLLPLLVAKLKLSLGDVGLLVAMASCASSLSQPLFGAWSDRLARPWFVVVGPLTTALFMTSIGVAPSFATLIALVMVAGIGSAAFHPQAAMLVARSRERAPFAMSVFVTAGTLGLAVGPLAAVGLATSLGLDRVWIAAAPGLLVALLTLRFLGFAPAKTARGDRPRLAELRPVARPLLLIYGCTVFRTMVSYGFQVFVPLLLHREGASLREGGAVVAAFLAGGGVGALIGGWSAERWGGRPVLLASFALALPLYATFVLVRGPLGVVALVLGQVVLQLSTPVNVLLGQSLSPRHASTIASLLMGAAWGMGQLLAAPAGALGDAVGLRPALLTLTGVLVLGWWCARALPRTWTAMPDVTAPVDPAAAAAPFPG